jgi:hypothetical protein
MSLDGRMRIVHPCIPTGNLVLIRKCNPYPLKIINKGSLSRYALLKGVHSLQEQEIILLRSVETESVLTAIPQCHFFGRMPTQEVSFYIMMEDKNDKFYTKV